MILKGHSKFPQSMKKILLDLKQQQISDHISQPYGSGKWNVSGSSCRVDAFGPGIEGQVERFETVGMEAAVDEGMPKSYLPQTVRRGGYMPQWKTSSCYILRNACKVKLKILYLWFQIFTRWRWSFAPRTRMYCPATWAFSIPAYLGFNLSTT